MMRLFTLRNQTRGSLNGVFGALAKVLTAPRPEYSAELAFRAVEEALRPSQDEVEVMCLIAVQRALAPIPPRNHG